MDGFLMFDPPSILEDLKFLGYYAITLHQKGIAFYATKDCTEGTLAKIGQFLRVFKVWLLQVTQIKKMLRGIVEPS
jgi:hypothetical protein